MSENKGGIYSPSNDPSMKHYTDRYDTLPKARAEIMRLAGICDDWRAKCEGWMKGYEEVEVQRDEARAALRKLAEVAKSDTDRARQEVKAAVEEWFTDVSLDDLFAVKGWKK
ncbi:MAG: hypothetical protein ACTHQ3_15905 [Motilibacteraceae bacterium]